MILLAKFFGWIFGSWQSPSRARLVYLGFTAGFVALAVGGAMKGDALVIALGLGFAIVTATAAMFAPKIASALLPEPERPRND